MKQKWFALLVAMCWVLLLLPGCTTRTTPIAVTSVPTAVVPTQQSQQTAPVAQNTPGAPSTPVAPETAGPTPDFYTRPQMTVKGKVASGADWGVTADGHYFLGSADAPILFTEFSDYQ